MPTTTLPRFIANPDPSIYLSDNYVVIDFEVVVKDGRYGSALDSRNSLFLTAYGSGNRVRYRFGDEYSQSGIRKAVENADFIVAHNAKYELGWLDRIGVDIANLLVFDTQIAEYVLLGNLVAGDKDSGGPRLPISLDACCKRRGWATKDPIVDIWMKNGIPVSDMPGSWVRDRCVSDVTSTERLFIDQRRELSFSDRLGVLYTRCIFTPVLASIEQEGMHLDKDRVGRTFAEYSEQYRELEERLGKQCGGINWRSPKQVASYLYDTLGFSELKDKRGEPKRGPTGLRLANKNVLAKLRAATETQRSFLALKSDIGRVGSALDKSLRYFKEVCDERDATFFAQFNQTVTATHRLSSTGIKSDSGRSVQFQNLPRDFKPLFTAKRDGWLIGEADGAQLEFRVAAFLGNDEQAKKDIQDGDIHLVSGAYLADTPYEDLKARFDAGDAKAKQIRQEAKAETFKPLYGGTKGTRAQERWYAGFRERYPQLAETQHGWELEVGRTNELVTPWGLRFYWPNASFRYNGNLNCRTAVYNYPVQSLATAEIIPIAVTYFWHSVRAGGLSDVIVPVNTVHDSLVAEIHPDYVEQFIGLARESFGPSVHNYLRTVYGMDFNVPLGVSTKVGEFWGEGEEQKFEYYGDAND